MINGWINLDKPIGISSTQAVTKVKRIFRIKKAGHLGTLDPLASGVLPIALGEATKTIPYLSCKLKVYNFTVKWGKQTNTDDLYGNIIKTSTIKPKFNQINCTIRDFVGEIIQIPPQFSAIKINGVRAYKLARIGQKISIKPRRVRIHELKLIFFDSANNSANFSVVCDSGVYVRSIVRDLGIKLNCFGYLTGLRRIMVGDFRENESVTIEQLSGVTAYPFASFKSVMLEPRKEEGYILVSSAKVREDIRLTESNAKSFIIPIELALNSISKVEVSLEKARKIIKGQEVKLNNLPKLGDYDIFCTVFNHVPIAICSSTNGSVKPVRVFNIFNEV